MIEVHVTCMRLPSRPYQPVPGGDGCEYLHVHDIGTYRNGTYMYSAPHIVTWSLVFCALVEFFEQALKSIVVVYLPT